MFEVAYYTLNYRWTYCTAVRRSSRASSAEVFCSHQSGDAIKISRRWRQCNRSRNERPTERQTGRTGRRESVQKMHVVNYKWDEETATAWRHTLYAARKLS